MKVWFNNILEAETRQLFSTEQRRVRIGRDADNDIVLNSPFVPGEAAALIKTNAGWEVQSLGLDSITVDEQELPGGRRLLLKTDATLRIWPFTLSVELGAAAAVQNKAERLEQEVADWTREVHLQLLKRIDLGSSADTRAQNAEYLLNVERHIDDIGRSVRDRAGDSSKMQGYAAGRSIRSHMLDELITSSGQKPGSIWQGDRAWAKNYTAVPDREDELKRLAAYVGTAIGLDNLPDLTQRLSAVERDFVSTWEKVQDQLDNTFVQYLAQRCLKKEVKDIVFGYGPLEDLLRNPTISEIMVVDRSHIYVERDGVLENSGRRFISDEVTLAIIERIVARVGRRIDKSKPVVDARLVDGSRVNAVIPPIAVSGPCLTVRKFPARKLLVDDLVAKGSLSKPAAEFLRAAVLKRCNILIAGGTGTGKTTLLNCLSDFIPDKERIVTIEDTAELQLKKEHVVRLETKQENVEGAGAYTIRELVKNALRMRPDRIVVGECRGAEALDMLQAMNTGHDGSMTTIHANQASDVILRLEVLCQMAADLPITSIHRQIVSAINIIVQLTRMHGGKRCVTQITEVVDVDSENNSVRLKDLFLRVDTPKGGELRPTGSLPTFIGELIETKAIDLEAFYL